LSAGSALRILEGRFAISRLSAEAPTPEWPAGEFVSICRTPDELSIVCAEDAVPAGVTTEGAWRCLAVRGPIPFEVTGVAARLTTPLAAAAIPLFLVSTFDTDYLLVKDAVFARAVDVLRASGWTIAEC
jgi:hypothetical protein